MFKNSHFTSIFLGCGVSVFGQGQCHFHSTFYTNLSYCSYRIEKSKFFTFCYLFRVVSNTVEPLERAFFQGPPPPPQLWSGPKNAHVSFLFVSSIEGVPLFGRVPDPKGVPGWRFHRISRQLYLHA